LQNEGKKIHHLGFGQSPFPVPPFAQESLMKHAHIGGYLPIQGDISLLTFYCLIQLSCFGSSFVTIIKSNKVAKSFL